MGKAELCDAAIPLAGTHTQELKAGSLLKRCEPTDARSSTVHSSHELGRSRRPLAGEWTNTLGDAQNAALLILTETGT